MQFRHCDTPPRMRVYDIHVRTAVRTGRPTDAKTSHDYLRIYILRLSQFYRCTGALKQSKGLELILKAALKYCDFNSFRNLAESATVRMLSGSAFQVEGPACENARSPNLVRSRGRE